jgi:hypothetical protein
MATVAFVRFVITFVRFEHLALGEKEIKAKRPLPDTLREWLSMARLISFCWKFINARLCVKGSLRHYSNRFDHRSRGRLYGGATQGGFSQFFCTQTGTQR